MKSTYQVKEAQAALPRLLRSEEVVTLCRREEVLGYFVPKAKMEALDETIELMANPRAMRILRAARSGRLAYRDLDLDDENLGLGSGRRVARRPAARS